MTTLREAAQQALEALEFSTLDAFMLDPISPGRESTIKAITALRVALAQQAEQQPMHPELRKMWEDHFDKCFRAIPVPEQAEPVAWRFEARHIDSAWAAAVTLKHPGPEGVYMRNVVPLYAAPPQRKPLTDDQLDDIAVAARRGNLYDLRIAIERAHGIGGDK